MSDEKRWLPWLRRVHEYIYMHLCDADGGGEWFGYLRRDNTVFNRCKGGNYKGFFHVPRGLLFAFQSAERHLSRHSTSLALKRAANGSGARSPFAHGCRVCLKFALMTMVCARTAAVAGDGNALNTRVHSQTPQPRAPVSVLFIPLDERFATRGLVLNLAPIAASSFHIITPPPELLPRHKQAADPRVLAEWVEARASSADALIASVEMLVYGGLIASRVSNDTIAEVGARVAWLSTLPDRYPTMRVLLSSVVMRIPSYDGTAYEKCSLALRVQHTCHAYAYRACRLASISRLARSRSRSALDRRL